MKKSRKVDRAVADQTDSPAVPASAPTRKSVSWPNRRRPGAQNRTTDANGELRRLAARRWDSLSKLGRRQQPAPPEQPEPPQQSGGQGHING